MGSRTRAQLLRLVVEPQQIPSRKRKNVLPDALTWYRTAIALPSFPWLTASTVPQQQTYRPLRVGTAMFSCIQRPRIAIEDAFLQLLRRFSGSASRQVVRPHGRWRC